MAYVNLIDLVYPVGSIYHSTSETSPTTLFGNTWAQITDRFLFGQGSKDNGTTGGEESHTLSIPEMPSHAHEVRYGFYNSGVSSNTQLGCYPLTLAQDRMGNWPIAASLTNSGQGAAHNNMPPYQVVYIWQRTQ